MDNVISRVNTRVNTTDQDTIDLFDITTEIARRYALTRNVQPEEIPLVFLKVYGFLHTLFQEELGIEDPSNAQIAARIEGSISPDSLTCLEDGLPFKSLKSHLRACHGMTPEQYRKKWGLRSDYPMVAPRYSLKRQEIAKSIGLGQKKKNESLHSQ